MFFGHFDVRVSHMLGRLDGYGFFQLVLQFHVHLNQDM